MKLKSFLTTNQFKKQLGYIIKNYKVISTKDLININDNKDYAVLTFDDGLLDHYDVASILYDNNITGTFLIPTLPIRDRVIIKSHKIQFILASVNEREVVNRIFKFMKSSEDEIKYLWNKFSVSTWIDNWWSDEMIFVTNILRNHKDGKKIVDELFKELVTENEIDFCESFYLNEKHLKDLVSAGMEIGGHGYSSEGLVNTNQEKEISESLKYVSKFYDDDLIFSYPNGSYDTKTLDLMKRYNCKFSYTTKKENITKDTNYLEIPRYDGPQDLPL
tara:strand:+ start:927 stop:1751 length:825 start_codon:yes stop_codon:yes gene_type:complete